MRELKLVDAAATEQLGAALGEAILAAMTGRCWVLLQGDLGAGKSTLARAALRALGITGPVPSPTYTLVEPYAARSGAAFHIDLYRLSDAAELQELGVSEWDGALALIEWPERVPELAARADLSIGLAVSGAGRRVRLEPLSVTGDAVVAGISRSYGYSE